MARKMQVSGWKSRLPARARVGFWGLEGWRTQFELGRGEARIMDHGCAALVCPRARDVFGSGRMERPGHIVLLPQNPRRHVCGTGAHRRELKTPAGIFIEGDAAGGNL